MIRILREFNNVVIPGGHWTGNTFHRNHAASTQKPPVFPKNFSPTLTVGRFYIIIVL